MRSISRVADVSINTVTKLLCEAGEACLAIHDEMVRNVRPARIQCDEIWSFCYAKDRAVAKAKAAPEGAGHVWTWTALDADSKLILSYFVGDRGRESACAFMTDLKDRVVSRPQITSDQWRGYIPAVGASFRAVGRFRAARQNLPRHSGRTWALQPRRLLRHQNQGSDWRPRSQAHLNVLRRAPEPNDAYVHAPVHSADQRFQQEARQPHPRDCALFCVLQFLPHPQNAARQPGNGRWRKRSALVARGRGSKIDEMAPPPKPRGPYKKQSEPVS